MARQQIIQAAIQQFLDAGETFLACRDLYTGSREYLAAWANLRQSFRSLVSTRLPSVRWSFEESASSLYAIATVAGRDLKIRASDHGNTSSLWEEPDVALLFNDSLIDVEVALDILAEELGERETDWSEVEARDESLDELEKDEICEELLRRSFDGKEY